jgi:predicted RNase H-like HicB family nuclease
VDGSDLPIWYPGVERGTSFEKRGETIDEARDNLKDAIQLLLEEVRREDAEKELEGRDVIRESLAL